MGLVLVIVILLGVGYFVLARSSRRRSRAHEAMQEEVETGEEIITAGGIHARVVESGDRQVKVEIAPGIVVTLDRRAIAAVAVPDEPEEPAEPDEAAEPGLEPGPSAEGAPESQTEAQSGAS